MSLQNDYIKNNYYTILFEENNCPLSCYLEMVKYNK